MAPPTALLTAPPPALPTTTTPGRILGPHNSAPLPTTTTPPGSLHSPAAVARLHPATARGRPAPTRPTPALPASQPRT